MENFFYILFFVIITGYLTLILWLIQGLIKLPDTVVLPEGKTLFSLVIPYRNEARRLPDLLESIAHLSYSKTLFEVIFVDDASSDNSFELVSKFAENHPEISIILLENQRQTLSPKKDAILTAITRSNMEWIISTDADCILPKNWLHAYDSQIRTGNPVFVVGPVSYARDRGFLYHFQQYDWMSLIGTGIASIGNQKPLLCSGANMAYSKEAFFEVKGFQGNDHIARGDDVFLLHKMRRQFPNRISFVNTAHGLVQTFATDTWKSLLNQRVRWARKSGHINSHLLQWVGIVVAASNLGLVITFVAGFLDSKWFWMYSLGLVIKFIVDTIFIQKLIHKLRVNLHFPYWLISSFLYPFYLVFIGFASLISGYHWKGRSFDK